MARKGIHAAGVLALATTGLAAGFASPAGAVTISANTDVLTYTAGPNEVNSTDIAFTDLSRRATIRDRTPVPALTLNGNCVLTGVATENGVLVRYITCIKDAGGFTSLDWTGNDFDDFLGVDAGTENVRVTNGDGGAGKDHLVGGTGSDNLLGGTGNDTLESGGNSLLATSDTLNGQADQDILIGGGGVDSMFGNGGNDTINGNGAGDFVNGGPENDKIFGGSGDDIQLFGDAGDDDIEGGDGADTIRQGTAAGFEGGGKLDGGNTNDVIVGGDSIAVVDRIFGGSQDDNITPRAGDDEGFGGTGQDRFVGTADADNPGNDHIEGDEERDVLNGGNGDDEVSGDEGADSLLGGDGTEDGVDKLFGSTGADDLDSSDLAGGVPVAENQLSCGLDPAGVSEIDRIRRNAVDTLLDFCEQENVVN